MDNPIRQSKGSDFSGDSTQTSKSLALDSSVLAGSTILVFVAAKKSSGTGAITLTVTDETGAKYTAGINSTNTGAGFKNTSFIKYAAIASSSPSVTVTASTTCFFTMVIVELVAPAGQAIFADVTNAASATTTTPATSAFDLVEANTFLIGGISHSAGSTIVITPGSGFTSLYTSNGDSTHLPMSVIYKVPMADQDTVNWTLGSSAACRGGGISMRLMALTAAEGVPSSAYPADVSYDMRDVAGVDGLGLGVVREHSSTAYAQVTGGTYIANGINGHACLRIAAGAIAGMVLSAAADYKTVFATMLSNSALFGADDAGHAADGAFYLDAISKNTVGKVGISGSSVAVNDGSGGTSMSGIPVVYGLTRTGTNTARLTVNGFKIVEVSLGGASLAATAITLFARFSAGAVADIGSGDFYAFRGYLTAQTEAQETGITSEMAYPLGQPFSSRIAIITHNAADSTMWAAESNDGITFTRQRRISFLAASGSDRDCSFEGYDSGTAAYYFCFTSDTGAQNTKYFGRMKSKGDFRLFIPAASVDCSAAAPIDGVTHAPWGPIPYFNNGVIAGYAVTESGTANVYESAVTGWPAAPTFSSPHVLSGNAGDQSTIIKPSHPGNPSASLYRLYGSVGKYQAASGIDGTYGSDVTLAGGSTGEGGYVLALDSNFFFYNPANTGYVVWKSTDNGTTFGAVQTVQGLNIATGASIDFGQGGFVDRGALALWSTPAIASILIPLDII